MPTSYYTGFDLVSIDSEGAHAPEPGTTVNVYDATNETSLGTVVTDDYGVIPGGTFSVAAGTELIFTVSGSASEVRRTTTAAEDFSGIADLSLVKDDDYVDTPVAPAYNDIYVREGAGVEPRKVGTCLPGGYIDIPYNPATDFDLDIFAIPRGEQGESDVFDLNRAVKVTINPNSELIKKNIYQSGVPVISDLPTVYLLEDTWIFGFPPASAEGASVYQLQWRLVDLTNKKELAEDVDPGETAITLVDSITDLPSEGKMVIGSETLSYAAKDNGTKTISSVVRGIEGSTAQSWTTGQHLLPVYYETKKLGNTEEDRIVQLAHTFYLMYRLRNNFRAGGSDGWSLWSLGTIAYGTLDGSQPDEPPPPPAEPPEEPYDPVDPPPETAGPPIDLGLVSFSSVTGIGTMGWTNQGATGYNILEMRKLFTSGSDWVLAGTVAFDDDECGFSVISDGTYQFRLHNTNIAGYIYWTEELDVGF